MSPANLLVLKETSLVVQYNNTNREQQKTHGSERPLDPRPLLLLKKYLIDPRHPSLVVVLYVDLMVGFLSRTHYCNHDWFWSARRCWLLWLCLQESSSVGKEMNELKVTACLISTLYTCTNLNIYTQPCKDHNKVNGIFFKSIAINCLFGKY